MSEEKRYERAIFTVAHTDIGGVPFNNHSRTLRVAVHSNTAAHALTVQFSNRCGHAPLPVGAASLALCGEDGTLRPDTLVPLTVGGVLSFELPAGEALQSDTVRFALQPGDYFALNIYYPTDERVASGNWLGTGAKRSKPGNFSADLSLPAPGLVSRFARTVVASDITVTTTTVSRIIAHADAPGRVVACFGDSITQQNNWTAPLTKLLYRAYPGEITLCNLGISGNRLLANSPTALGGLNGIAGIDRFEEDVLRLPGLTHAILEIGSNDIGLPGSGGVPESELISPTQYADAMEGMANKLRENGVKAYVATIPPRAVNFIFDEEREALRQQMNEWIRTATCFDAVLDFDAALRRPDGKPGMREGAALPDRLHPSPYGGLLLAKSIDLSLFRGEAHA